MLEARRKRGRGKKGKKNKPGVVAYACNPSTEGVRGRQIGQPGLQSKFGTENPVSKPPNTHIKKRGRRKGRRRKRNVPLSPEMSPVDALLLSCLHGGGDGLRVGPALLCVQVLSSTFAMLKLRQVLIYFPLCLLHLWEPRITSPHLTASAPLQTVLRPQLSQAHRPEMRSGSGGYHLATL